MQASNTLRLPNLLSLLAILLVLAAPCALAKKDLFGNEPGAKQSHQVEQLVPIASSSSSVAEAKEEAPVAKHEEKTKTQAPENNAVPTVEPEQKSSYFETQLSRLKGHLVEAKEDLFGSKKSAKKETPAVPQQTEQSPSNNAHPNEDEQPELPVISATEAAQRAQSITDGQVINVRKYQEDNSPRYAVKLLQKNGRMKTINLDAVSGALIEETPQ